MNFEVYIYLKVFGLHLYIFPQFLSDFQTVLSRFLVGFLLRLFLVLRFKY